MQRRLLERRLVAGGGGGGLAGVGRSDGRVAGGLYRRPLAGNLLVLVDDLHVGGCSVIHVGWRVVFRKVGLDFFFQRQVFRVQVVRAVLLEGGPLVLLRVPLALQVDLFNRVSVLFKELGVNGFEEVHAKLSVGTYILNDHFKVIVLAHMGRNFPGGAVDLHGKSDARSHIRLNVVNSIFHISCEFAYSGVRIAVMAPKPLSVGRFLQTLSLLANLHRTRGRV